MQPYRLGIAHCPLVTARRKSKVKVKSQKADAVGFFADERMVEPPLQEGFPTLGDLVYLFQRRYAFA
jgi:hypothetical protein